MQLVPSDHARTWGWKPFVSDPLRSHEGNRKPRTCETMWIRGTELELDAPTRLPKVRRLSVQRTRRGKRRPTDTTQRHRTLARRHPESPFNRVSRLLLLNAGWWCWLVVPVLLLDTAYIPYDEHGHARSTPARAQCRDDSGSRGLFDACLLRKILLPVTRRLVYAHQGAWQLLPAYLVTSVDRLDAIVLEKEREGERKREI